MSKERVSPSEKLFTVHQVLEGNELMSQAAARLGVNFTTVQTWVRLYRCDGEDAFLITKSKRYPKELKEQAVLDYLAGKGSLHKICQLYKIRSRSKLHNWIKKYNGHEELKVFGTGGTTIMAKGRKTSFNERVEIVQYCIVHDHNYADTAQKYGISYQQVRSYTVKYETGGVDALQDRRGRSKPVEEMSELEKLRAEKERAEMEVSFLKKLEEIERRRG